jgi:hypothetical protein
VSQKYLNYQTLKKTLRCDAKNTHIIQSQFFNRFLTNLVNLTTIIQGKAQKFAKEDQSKNEYRNNVDIAFLFSHNR